MTLFTAELLDEYDAIPKVVRPVLSDDPPLMLREHDSRDAGARICANADNQATFSYGVDFSTPQQMLVREVAGKRLLQVPVGTPAAAAAELLVVHLRRLEATTLNVTGNSLAKVLQIHPMDPDTLQEKLDGYILRVLTAVHREYPLRRIVSGGQTGVEESATKAAVKIHVPAFALLPQGYAYTNSRGERRTADRMDTLLRLMPPRPLVLPPI